MACGGRNVFYCGIAQTCLEMGLKGELNGLSAVLIPVLCDTLKCLGQNWKAGVKEVPFIPVVHPQNRRMEAGKIFLAGQYRRIAARLQEISGTEVTDKGIWDAIALCNEHRSLMREFSEVAARHPDLISPSARNAVIKSGFFMPKPEHSAMLLSLIEACRKQKVVPWPGRRIVVTGIIADSPAILSMFEENGMAVVADEVAHESRQFRTDVPAADNPYDALAAQFAAMEGCSVLYDAEKKRADMVVELARKHEADGVVLLLTKFCDPEEFDAPVLRRAVENAGIPFVSIEVDQQTPAQEQARTALQTFAEIMG